MSKRKSFVLYTDTLDVFQDLSPEQSLDLILAIRAYQVGEDYPLTGMLKAMFNIFKNQFDRDNEKYEEMCERNKTYGQRGGRPKGSTKADGIKKTMTVNSKPKKADSDNDSDSDSDNDSGNDIDITPLPPTNRFDEFWINYPRQRRGGRDKAEQAYLKAITRDSEDSVLTGLMSYAVSDEVTGGFAKGAAAWLNDDRWTNDYSTNPTGGLSNDRPKQTTTDANREAFARWVDKGA